VIHQIIYCEYISVFSNAPGFSVNVFIIWLNAIGKNNKGIKYFILFEILNKIAQITICGIENTK
jgi:hypothetical protein